MDGTEDSCGTREGFQTSLLEGIEEVHHIKSTLRLLDHLGRFRRTEPKRPGGRATHEANSAILSHIRLHTIPNCHDEIQRREACRSQQPTAAGLPFHPRATAASSSAESMRNANDPVGMLGLATMHYNEPKLSQEEQREFLCSKPSELYLQQDQQSHHPAHKGGSRGIRCGRVARRIIACAIDIPEKCPRSVGRLDND